MEASPDLKKVIGAVRNRRMAGIRMVMERKDEFPDLTAAQLTGIALDPPARQLADQILDGVWRDRSFRHTPKLAPELIIGSGFHAATYAATRVQMGYPRPLIVERSPRPGGVFAYPRDVFYLNSRNRRGGPGLSGDQGASLNYLPGAPIQAANLSPTEYQTNADMAFVIRLALAQSADVRAETTVDGVARIGNGYDVTLVSPYTGTNEVNVSRIIDARGLGDPRGAGDANGTTILTFDQFMTRMSAPWPLRGIRRAAIIGGGDSARCAAESLLGLAPKPFMGAAELDTVDRVDWYGNVPITFDDWCRNERGRYKPIGRYLRPDKFGVTRLTVTQGSRFMPVALPGQVLVNGRSYDLVILATGNQETEISGLESFSYEPYTVNRTQVATKSYQSSNAFRIGPHADLAFTPAERQAGVDEIGNNRVAMFRLGTKTATLAATLPPVDFPA